MLDNPEFRGLKRDPVFLWVQPRDPFASLRMFGIAQPIPNTPSNVELIAQDAGAAFTIAVDGGLTPVARTVALAAWGRDPVGIEIGGILDRRFTCGVFREYPLHHQRLIAVDVLLALDDVTGCCDGLDIVIGDGQKVVGHTRPPLSLGVLAA